VTKASWSQDSTADYASKNKEEASAFYSSAEHPTL
jgi:hypothetical protein